uniref:Serpin B6 n=1 Tax=Pseudonaja textilis TaxID=8673 RepID=A0A670ZCZ5_PSETE
MGSRFEANTKFALNFFKELSANDPSDNVVCSPFTISSSLLMVLLGARNNTEAQILKVYQDTFYQKGKKRVGCVHQRSGKFISDINKLRANYSLSLVNQFFGETSYDFLAGELNESKTVQMMFKKAKYNMAHISAYQTSVLEIPFGDNELSMIILLPDEIADNSTGLEKREITYEKLMDWINPEKMFPREIELSFPKFKLEEKYDLKPVLRSMGMTDAFDEGKADFSRMSTNKDLALSEVIHKAFLEVNEEGTEAAAATGVIRVFKSAQPPLKFTADHPFLYFITERSTNSIVVIGRYSSP